MSLSKKALLIGIGSTIAVGGVTTAIAVPLATSSSTPSSAIPATEIRPATSIKALVKELKADDVVVSNEVIATEENANTFITPVNRENTYAFDLKSSQFSLTQQARNKFPDRVSFKFELTSENNKTADLNNGSVTTTIKAFVDETEVTTTTVTLDDFKKANAEVVKLFKNEGNNVVLDLAKVTDSTYKTIETLNELKEVAVSEPETRLTEVNAEAQQNKPKESGLTTLLHKLQKPEESTLEIKNLSVEGNVRLNNISIGSEDDANPVFNLVKQNDSSSLKLINTNGETKEEALVDQIVVSNLLASHISVKPSGINAEDNKKFVEEFSTGAMGAGYKKVDSNIQLEVKEMETTGNVVSALTVNPYLVEKTQKDQEVKGNLLVSFGSGETAKTYDLSDEANLKELKAASFGFSVYVKKIDSSKDKIIMANSVLMGSELKTYFATNNFTMPVDPMTTFMMSQMQKGGFTNKDVMLGDMVTQITLGTASKEEKASAPLDTNQMVIVDENWVIFVTYTYKGITNSHVLLTPSIDVIHLEVKKATLPEEIAPEGSAGHSDGVGAQA